MAEIEMCEPWELFNLLNQQRNSVSRLAQSNYLCLFDAQEIHNYRTSHIITAKNIKQDADGSFVLPEAVELDSMQHVVVYDGNTGSLEAGGRAVDCARALAKTTFCPVRVVRGGFQRFSALYPFIRTEKIIYTIAELENLKIYPVEVTAGQLYMGDQQQGADLEILRDLKIKAVVNISESDAQEESREENQNVLIIPVADSVFCDLFSHFEKICSFIAWHFDSGSRVLIISKLGRSRCSAATTAVLMHRLKHTMEATLRFVIKCKPSARPSTILLRQLSDWEIHTLGSKMTDISEPHFLRT
ncbi:serine/threonine/tyrosine-interacting-like protein 1 [Nelusetta ayraudi]|uniref:serine/threonine/tyrosine-interacting-like protein 1 n=1 Tax=Nelusetta ayraudi TaxID=303726 RepID=UPI003F70AB60